MRTAVVRIGVDPAGQLSADQLDAGMTELSALVDDLGARLIHDNLASLSPKRREVEILMTVTEPDRLQTVARDLCARAFGTEPVLGVLTFVSHGTDEDAHGVLAAFGLSGEIERVPSGPDGPGWDIVTVTLRKEDLTRVPESRVHTALEASTNAEVHIRTV